MLNLIKKITCCHGLSGSEKQVSEVIRGAISPYVDKCYSDTLGNLIAVKTGRGDRRRKIMLCAHMDEIGYMVTYIEDNGNIRFSNIGGINFIAASYTSVVSGRGVPGALVPEGGLKSGEITFNKCYIDIGAKNRKEAERLVSVGDSFVQEPYVKGWPGSG